MCYRAVRMLISFLLFFPTDSYGKDVSFGDERFASRRRRWLSYEPPVHVVTNCLNQTDVNNLLHLAHNHLSVSGTSTVHSSSLYLKDKSNGNNPALRRVAERASQLTGLSIENFEAPSMTRYKTAQFYGLHFDSGFYLHKKPVARTATFLAYLNTVSASQGGRTVFPYASPVHKRNVKSYFRTNKLPAEGDARPQLRDVCNRESGSLLVQPTAGSCLLFYNHAHRNHHDDQVVVDRRSMHGSCPLHFGEKWIIQIWLHDQHRENLTDFWT